MIKTTPFEMVFIIRVIMFVSTYDIVEMVIDEATEQFGNRWVIPKAKKKNLKTDCDLIDRLVSEFDCESAEADIDDETMKLKVSVVCPDMVLEYGRTHPFFTLIQHAESFSFSAVEDSLKVDFVFAGLWESKD